MVSPLAIWPVALPNEECDGGMQASELASDVEFSFLANSSESP